MRIARLFLFLAVLCPFSSAASAQTKIGKFIRYVGREAKGVVTDLKNPEWASMVFVVAAAQTADTVTTCRGLDHGLVEGNPLFQHTRSCAKFAFGANLLLISELVATHSMVTEFTDECHYEAEDPTYKHHDWWKGYNPEGCKHVMWLPALVGAPSHVVNAIGNENLLNKKK